VSAISERMTDLLTLPQGDGPNWIVFVGEIPVAESVKVSGFKSAGLIVRVGLSG
jgi:hypothetical protein